MLGPFQVGAPQATSDCLPSMRGSDSRQPQSATPGCQATNKKTTFNDKSSGSKPGLRESKLSLTSAAGSTSNGKDCVPYWNEQCAENSLQLWLPTATGLPDSALNSSAGWSSETVEKSWFSVNLQKAALPTNLPRTFWQSLVSSLPECTDLESTVIKSRKIRIYPTARNKQAFKQWVGASRFTYNVAVEYLNGLDSPRPHWTVVAKDVLASLPEWSNEVPYQVKKIAVRDACEAFSEAKLRSLKTGQPFRMSFRSRKDPQQSCFLPKSAVSDKGVYYTLSGTGLRWSESFPESYADCRLIFRGSRWYVTVPFRMTTLKAENQGRVVALDPGIRSFLTYYAEDQFGHLGQGDFGRIQRLASHLDNLISRTSKAKRRRKQHMRRAQCRMRWKLRDLIDELHWKCCRFLVDNFDVIVIPPFETSQMSRRLTRKIRSKSVRSMITFAHYRFQQRLRFKALECGKTVVQQNEAYTSKTCSWSGEIVDKLGGRRVIRGSDGVSMDRDVNGARGILLRALRDTASAGASGRAVFAKREFGSN